MEQMEMDKDFEEVAKAIRFTIVPKNARILKLIVRDAHYAKMIDDSNVEAIDLDGYIINRDKIITINKQKYNIQFIKDDKAFGAGYSLYTYILSKSYNFIMPALGSKANAFRKDLEFCNCFIGMEGNELYGDSIYLLYRFNSSRDFINFERSLMAHSMYKATHNVDKYHIMYEFNIPEKYKGDVDKILDGKYSYISEAFKERIINFHGGRYLPNGDNNPGTKDIIEILERSARRRRYLEDKYDITIPKDVDLLDKFSVNNEIYLDRYRIPKEDNSNIENTFEIR